MSGNSRKKIVRHLSMDDLDRLLAAYTDEKLTERLIFLKRLYKGATLEDLPTSKPRPGRPRICDEATRVHITALACELPADRGLPPSRFSSADIHAEATRELDPCPARSTIAAWLASPESSY